MIDRLNRLLRVERHEWSKLFQFGLFGFLLQMGMGVGFSAGDAAFFGNVGAGALPVIFILTPLVMLVYTGLFSALMMRLSLDHVVTATLVLLAVGGLAFWFLLGRAEGSEPLYYALKLYLAMWYIALYSLFWNYTDAFFDIQDAKRLFPLFAAFCALGTATGGLVVSLLAETVSLAGFLLFWAAIALATIPLARALGRRWTKLNENDLEESPPSPNIAGQVAILATNFRKSPFTLALTATLFVTLLMTNLAEYQYAEVFQQGRTEAELAALFGSLYAFSNIFNLFVCLFLFNRLIARIGVRNVAFILPFAYFGVFGFFFLDGGYWAAVAAFVAYHGVLTSIEYNNQNLLFNAMPSGVKRTLRTIIEGMCEPLASLVAGLFLLYAAKYVDARELSGIGVMLGALLIAIVVTLRQLYPAAMAGNMRRGWLDFGAIAASPDGDDRQPVAHDRIRTLLAETAAATPRRRRQIGAALIDHGETAIPPLVAALRDRRHPYPTRAVAARALASLSLAQFVVQSDALLELEIGEARQAADGAASLDAAADASGLTALLARAQRERASAAIDFLLEILALRGLLPDADLLIVSLHSSNAKVRANAMETIETGLGHKLFRQIDSILRPNPRERDAPPSLANITELARASLDQGSMIEAAIALALLDDRLSIADFAAITAPIIRADMPEPLRCQILAQMAMRPQQGPGLVPMVDALARHPDFGGATLEALADLAAMAQCTPPGATPAFGCAARGGEAFWIGHAHIRDVAARRPDLALVMLRVQDGRAHAA
ncbi:MAG: MFS transporter [Sphingopyxis sp.]|uniref:MFS transporter n=1 Tax=Sphingopyxis sp. TaxID=1908224 RepID=UPI002ABCECF8|nr:MFS transporter [Sphingopyxis sp.]MDZ3832703.1 MFS transporter [Sphingopyxis sp.]